MKACPTVIAAIALVLSCPIAARADAPAPVSSSEVGGVSSSLRLSTDSSDAELSAGDDAFEHGDWTGAERHYTAARSSSRSAAAAIVGIARARIGRVGVPLDFGAAKGNAVVAAAAADLQRVVERNATLGPAFVELGRARLLLGDSQRAVSAMRRGVELLADNPEAHSELGVGLLATGDVEGAIKELGRAVELDPGCGARHGNLGTALMMAGRTREAIVEYEARVRLDDADARAHSDLGTALLSTPDTSRAIVELRRAVALRPQGPAFHQNLGYALQQAGRVNEAVLEYRTAIRLDANLVSAWINLATALARDRATRSEARSALGHARALSPNDPRVRANLSELDALDRMALPDGGLSE